MTDDDDMITGAMLEYAWLGYTNSKKARKLSHPDISTKIALKSSIFNRCWNEGYRMNRLDKVIMIVYEDSFTGEEMMKG
jgi:hypothetical protein